MSHSKLLDNSTEDYSLKSFVAASLRNSSFSEVAIATGYWDLPGMAEILPQLQAFLSRENVSFRLLLGEEPSVKNYQIKNPESQDPKFPKHYVKRDLEDLELKDEFQLVVQLLSEHLASGKLQIKVYKKNFLHAKCYIFGSESENAVGVIGSSNFTKQGLVGNLELNEVETHNAAVNFKRLKPEQHPSHRSWFEELWNESEDWSRLFKEELLDLSKHGDLCFSPYEMYVHALYRIYIQELLDEAANEVTQNDEGKPQLLTFQLQNANSLISKLDSKGVAMLSDSVGLGKTYTTLKVVEKFKLERNERVVIICPAGLKSQWLTAFNDFKMIPCEIYSMQDVNAIEDVKNRLRDIPVHLFVFDESHNLRTSGGKRFETFIQWRIANLKAKTLLVTATPINNQITDLTNQVMLALGGEFNKLGHFYDSQRERRFTLKERFDLLRRDINRQLKESGRVDYEELREQIRPYLNKFIVRRTRQGIEKDNPDGLEINGVLQKFPEAIPRNLEYDVQNEFKADLLEMAKASVGLTQAFNYKAESLTQLVYLKHPLHQLDVFVKRENNPITTLEIVYTAILSLGFPSYRYNIYQHRYYGKKVEDLELGVDENRELSRQTGIYGIFRTIFLKRLESSLHAIWLSVNNYEKKLQDFKKNLYDRSLIVSVKDMSVLDEIVSQYNEESASDDQLDTLIQRLEEQQLIYSPADEVVFNIDQLKADIEQDLAIVSILRKQIEKLREHDNKLLKLATKLDELHGKKVLVFTYFADTLRYMNDNLPALLRKKRNIEFALANSRHDIENFASRFSPLAKKHQWQPGEVEIDCLGATDKLSEGQNLQDCGIIINYDLHWNPVRMIQRNGRINRLGGTHTEIFIYNFRPTEQLEGYLRLVNRLREKIDLIRYTIGSDQSVLDEAPMPQEFTEDLYSRDEKKRIEAYKKIIERSDILAAGDFFLDDLRAFHYNDDLSDEYKQSISEMPRGKWGHVMNKSDSDRFSHLAHVMDENAEAGYFVELGHDGGGTLIPTDAGLMKLQTASDNNQRFADRFANKPNIEKTIVGVLGVLEYFDKNDIAYTEAQQEAIHAAIEKMELYGKPEADISAVYHALYKSTNHYVNDKMRLLVREATRNLRNGRNLDTDNLLDRMIKVATDIPTDTVEKQKSPLDEIIQIFVR